jgi:hypothetical protein
MNAYDLIRKLQEEVSVELDRKVKDPREIDLGTLRVKQDLITHMIELLQEEDERPF